MQKIKWVDKHIEITPPKRPKKLTATRFGTVLGCNPWATDFEVWCAITRTYQEPFTDTIYTIAGKTIEPKQAEYMEKSYGMTLVSPTSRYGENYFKETRGDFFPNEKVLGGMWDYLAIDETADLEAVLEMKTTKRAEDWVDDIPEYYALQAALYAYLLGTDNVIMVASFLQPEDYDHPEKFKPAADNTITREFKVSERYPDFEQKIVKANEWWAKYVLTGISPDYDEKKDADILKELRTYTLPPEVTEDDDLFKSLINEAESLKADVAEVKATIANKEKRLKKITSTIKDYAIGEFREGDTKVAVEGTTSVWVVSKSDKVKTAVDLDALKNDGLYDKYVKETIEPSYRINVKNKEVK